LFKVNVYMISLLLMDTMGSYERIMISTVIVIHIATGSFPLFTIAVVSKELHRTKKYLVPIQQALQKDRIGYKLKFDDLFGRLTRGKKYGLTIGPIAT